MTSPTPAPRERRPVLVVSHERSGTHFLMNTLDACFGYHSWTDVDELAGTPVRSTPDFLRFLFHTAWPPRTVLKCHYHAAFLPLLRRLATEFHVIHIVREPSAALLSFWRFVRLSGPRGGPQSATVAEFVRARPDGNMVRYQAGECATVAERWSAHTRSWLAAARAVPAITCLRYDALDERFAETVSTLAGRLGRLPDAVDRPPRSAKGMAGRSPSELPGAYDSEDRAFLERTTGDAWSEVVGAS